MISFGSLKILENLVVRCNTLSYVLIAMVYETLPYPVGEEAATGDGSVQWAWSRTAATTWQLIEQLMVFEDETNICGGWWQSLHDA